MPERLVKLARFCAVGLACLGIGIVALYGLDALAGLDYRLAYAGSFVITNVAGYLLNARFTFATKSVSHAGALRYMTVNAALLGVNTLALELLVERLHLWYLAAAVLLAALNMPLSFLGQWLFTYRAPAGDPTAAI
jgi:putative flippase GtrA